MTDIQQARDVLAKWREQADSAAIIAARNYTSDTGARLVVGTAGNPELWDAIDEEFALFAISEHPPRLLSRIATAIVAADDRMTP